MNATDRFEAKDPAEQLVLAFDYEPALDAGEELAAPFSLRIFVDRGGPDPNSNFLLNGAAEIDADSKTALLVPVKGGVHMTDYRIFTECATTNPSKYLVVAGILPVRNA